MRRVFVAVAALAFGPAARSAVLVVPSPTYPSITLALLAATAGDTISIKAGTYTQPIALLGATGVTVKGKGTVIIEAASLQNGIALTACTDCSIENVLVRHSLGVGVLVTSGSGNTLTNVKVQASVGTGFQASASSTLTLKQCAVDSTLAGGFVLATSSSSITKCAVDGCVTGFTLDGANNVVTNLAIANGTALGVVLGGSSATTANVLDGIKVTNVTDVGLDLGPFADGNSVRAVTILFGITTTGVFVESGADFNRLTSVKVIKHGNSGCQVSGDNNVFQSFVSSKSGGDGFTVAPSASGNLFLEGLVEQSPNGGYSIFGSGNTFIRNKAKKNVVAPFFQAMGASNAYLGNDFPEP